MNGTLENIDAGSLTAGPELALIALIGLVLATLYGLWLGRLTAQPSSLQKAVLRRALDERLEAIQEEEGKDGMEYRVAAELRYGRTLREK